MNFTDQSNHQSNFKQLINTLHSSKYLYAQITNKRKSSRACKQVFSIPLKFYCTIDISTPGRLHNYVFNSVFICLLSHTEIQLQYVREQGLKRFSSDPSPLLPGSSRETQRTLSTGSTTSGDGEQECPPPLLLTKEEDLSTTTDGNTKPPADRPFEVGDLVKVEQKDSPWYGVIRWIGQLPGNLKCIAGIEMVILSKSTG